MKLKDIFIGREYGLKDTATDYRVTVINVNRNVRPGRVQVLIRDHSLDSVGGRGNPRRQTSSEVVPVRNVSVRNLRP